MEKSQESDTTLQAPDVRLDNKSQLTVGGTPGSVSLKASSEGNVENEKPEVTPAESSGAEEPDYYHGARLGPVILALILVVFLIALDQTIVGTAIPKITDQFHGLEAVPWYGAAYFMTFGGFQSFWGKIYKYFPLKISFLLTIFIFEVGSLICGVAQNSTTLIVGRAIAGVGGSGVATGAFTIIAFAVAPQTRPSILGMVGSAYGISAVVGPLLGGAFTDRVNWRWCFYINLPIGGVSGIIILILFTTPKHARPQPATLKEKVLQMDLTGVVLVMGAIISFILAVQKGQTRPWGNSLVVGLLVGFVLIGSTFVIWQWYQGERAIVPIRLIKQRPVWTGALYAFFFGGSYFIILYYLPIYFQSVDGSSPINSGVRNLPMVIMVAISTATTGVIQSKTGQITPCMVIGGALATIVGGLLYSMDEGTSAGKWIGYQILGGVAYGIGWQAPIVRVQAHAKPEDMATSTAIVFFFQIVGGAFTVSAAQSAFANRLWRTLAKTAPDISSYMIIGTGATDIRTVFGPDQLPLVIDGYMKGIKLTFALVIATAGASFLLSFVAPWEKINQEKVKESGGIA